MANDWSVSVTLGSLCNRSDTRTDRSRPFYRLATSRPPECFDSRVWTEPARRTHSARNLFVSKRSQEAAHTAWNIRTPHLITISEKQTAPHGSNTISCLSSVVEVFKNTIVRLMFGTCDEHILITCAGENITSTIPSLSLPVSEHGANGQQTESKFMMC